MLDRVEIPHAAKRAAGLPAPFSGGMRQRVMIAMALSCSAQAPDRRRTDDGARRDHPGADHRPAALPARRAVDGDDLRHPRPRGDRRRGRRRRGHVRRPDRRGGTGAAPSSAVRGTPTPRRCCIDPAAHPGGEPLHAIPGMVPRPDELTASCRFRASMRLRRGALCRGLGRPAGGPRRWFPGPAPARPLSPPGRAPSLARWQGRVDRTGPALNDADPSSAPAAEPLVHADIVTHSDPGRGDRAHHDEEAGPLAEHSRCRGSQALPHPERRPPTGHGQRRTPSTRSALAISTGTTLGLVGESGSGKSTLARLVLRLIDPTAGTVWSTARTSRRSNGSDLRRPPGLMQMVFQDPYSSLDPRRASPTSSASRWPSTPTMSRAERTERVVELLAQVGLSRSALDRYPHEFSGGQRQRIAIARALALHPRLLVCDEPVSALDVSTQSQVINLLTDLQAELGVAYLFIAHDLSVVRHISDRIAVMYLGQIVEEGDADEVYARPAHPYTAALLSAIPIPDPTGRENRKRSGAPRRGRRGHDGVDRLPVPRPMRLRHGRVRLGRARAVPRRPPACRFAATSIRKDRSWPGRPCSRCPRRRRCQVERLHGPRRLPARLDVGVQGPRLRRRRLLAHSIVVTYTPTNCAVCWSTSPRRRAS